MSTSSNISQSTYSPSEPETPQGAAQNRIQSFDQSLNHAELGLSIEQSLKNAQKEMHQKRIQALRKELDYLKSTEWEFEYDKEHEKEEDYETDKWVAEQIMEFEFTELQKQPVEATTPDSPVIPRNATCFHRTGVITFMEYPDIQIDGQYIFDVSSCSLSLNLNDKVTYLGYKNELDHIVITRILESHGMVWEAWDEEHAQESKFQIIEHLIVAEVDFRKERLVFLKDNDLKFSLDDVEGTMVPIAGDWLELNCSVQLDENTPYNISGAQVLKVVSYKPLRCKVKSAVVTEWNGSEGTCDRQIYFNKQCLTNGLDISTGQKVLVEAIESNQGSCAWRVIKLVTTGERVQTPNKVLEANYSTAEDVSLQIEKEKQIKVTYPIKFDKVDLNETSEIVLRITNKSKQIQFLNKLVILSKKKDSQIEIFPAVNRPYKIYPDQSYCLTITCKPKFLGVAKENIVIMFRGFKVERVVEMNVVSDDWVKDDKSHVDYHYIASNKQKIAQLNRMRQNQENNIVPGQRPIKSPHFISGKLGIFNIPDRVWSAVIGDSSQVVYTDDYDKVLFQIEDKIPCISQDLSINNYTDKWHNLLYMEEIQENINIRVYDSPKTFLIKCQEFLGLEVTGLSERRPSLLVGDKAIVKDIWENNASRYEGFIHAIRGDLILMKFQRQFQENYSGSDVSIEFHFSRTKYRRAHQAVNLAISNLGHEILFPTRVMGRQSQLPPEKLNSIQWFNKNLNNCQKAAVSNILLGQCRPKPYCIYGPPGTGKTITVIETILQVLTLLPDSRILVAAPSNSAANMITERLLQYKQSISNSFIRVVANHLIESDKIPHKIKPYCATLEIGTEGTRKSTYGVQDGIHRNCTKSFIGRQRVTIGTCSILGTLTQIGFPKGHFTHIIVDEAGQATEPEIMIALTFTDKDNGQIVLAGDPMQLGPVVMSRYAQEFGMAESYLCRLLETFPYQKDFAAFENGFNEKLVTKLNDNYRSLREVIALPSQMFYDGSLVAKIERNQPWIQNIMKVMNEIFDSGTSRFGGIYVNGIRGENARAKDSPSWYNRHEASMVAMTTCQLYKGNIGVDDIGIITPYVAQIRYLRIVFESLGLPEPKIGTVEEFQGQERPLIIISTVRSSSSLLQDDQKNNLGFVSNPKRLNVALTRARVAVLLVCDPHLLCTDPLWSKVVNQAVKEDKYMGCDLPTIIDETVDNKV